MFTKLWRETEIFSNQCWRVYYWPSSRDLHIILKPSTLPDLVGENWTASTVCIYVLEAIVSGAESQHVAEGILEEVLVVT